ncbi:MAG: trehalase family glycosidase, partial [Acidobacteriaceae bacterium]
LAPDLQSESGAPILPPDARKRSADALIHYFAECAPKLLRDPEGSLKYPSVSPSLPGKEYSTSLWDWDTYWTARGLFRVARVSGNPQLHSKVCEHAQGSLLNFLDHQSEEGRIPLMLDVTDPDPFGCLRAAAPNTHNQAKPVMGQLALLIADERQSVEWIASRFDDLLRFYDSWRLGNLASIGLFVWGDDVAIGDDNDPTTFGRPFFSSANLLLNCLFYQDLLASAELARRLDRYRDHDLLSSQAQGLAQRIQTFCWDPRDSYYYTVDVQCVDRRAELIPHVPRGMAMSWKCLPLRIQMFTGFLPLWCGIAPQLDAQKLVNINYLADDRLRAPWGVRSLSNRETMYSLAFSSNPSNWLGPVWITVNYFVWKALQRYGFGKEAGVLADKTLLLLSRDLQANGSLNEYYDPDTGAALSHKGFLDWNLLVLEML